jgi:hypothetical protein
MFRFIFLILSFSIILIDYFFKSMNTWFLASSYLYIGVIFSLIVASRQFMLNDELGTFREFMGRLVSLSVISISIITFNSVNYNNLVVSGLIVGFFVLSVFYLYAMNNVVHCVWEKIQMMALNIIVYTIAVYSFHKFISLVD